MAQHKVVVLTDAETATGYRLAGVETRVSTPADAQAALDDIINSEGYGLVVVDEGLLEDPVKAAERSMRGRQLPVILPVGSLSGAFAEDSGDALAYMNNLVRSAIGFDIKLE